ncbi:Metaxin-1 [Chionoecetes opilio]|uniref:Metaxin-1 n=1 Tax=Chionoecetes opilio TaxID=41210 RepID=A0A8J4YGR1_CHIOP|nr:Metaxin-1 [Chionoecetes opilio]
MDWVLGKVVDQSDCGASVSNTKITDLVFADETVIFAESLEVLVMALEALHEEAKPLELEVSWLKTKVQVFGGLLDETVQWVEPKSYYDVIHKWYFSSMPFPHKLWYPRKYHQGYCDLINSMFDDPDDNRSVETEDADHGATHVSSIGLVFMTLTNEVKMLQASQALMQDESGDMRAQIASPQELKGEVANLKGMLVNMKGEMVGVTVELVRVKLESMKARYGALMTLDTDIPEARAQQPWMDPPYTHPPMEPKKACEARGEGQRSAVGKQKCAQLHKQAQECLTMLSNRLGDREYFFGRTPSTLDAVIFSYLALLLKVDLKVPVLQNHIKACPNLSRYVSKTIQRFFPSEAQRSTDSRDSVPKDDVPNKGRNLLLSGLVALSAMFGYAIAAGLVQRFEAVRTWDEDLGEGVV